MSETRSVHELLASVGLIALPHECSEFLCNGWFRWLALRELESAGRFAMDTGVLPPEAATRLAAALHNLDTLKKAA